MIQRWGKTDTTKGWLKILRRGKGVLNQLLQLEGSTPRSNPLLVFKSVNYTITVIIVIVILIVIVMVIVIVIVISWSVLYWHISRDCDVFFFCYCLGLVIVPFLFCVYINMFQCRYVTVLLYLCRYSVLASSGHFATTWSTVSWNWTHYNPTHWVCTIF